MVLDIPSQLRKMSEQLGTSAAEFALGWENDMGSRGIKERPTGEVGELRWKAA